MIRSARGSPASHACALGEAGGKCLVVVDVFATLEISEVVAVPLDVVIDPYSRIAKTPLAPDRDVTLDGFS
jgi:hypothetical protein